MQTKRWISVVALTLIMVLGASNLAYAGWLDFLSKTRDDRRETGAGPTVAVRG